MKVTVEIEETNREKITIWEAISRDQPNGRQTHRQYKGQPTSKTVSKKSKKRQDTRIYTKLSSPIEREEGLIHRVTLGAGRRVVPRNNDAKRLLC